MEKKTLSWPAIAFAGVLALAGAAQADEVQLVNGDRVSGEIVGLEGGTLLMKSPYGELAIAWAEVVAVRTDRPLLVTVAGEEPRTAVLLPVAGGRVALRVGDTDQAQVDLEEIIAMASPEPPLVLTGGANVGVVQTGGNTRINSVHFDGEVVARARQNRYTAGGLIGRAEDDGRETARRATGYLRYDRFVGDRLYVNANSLFTRDRFRDLDLRTAVGAGLGLQVWETPAASLAAELGAGFVDENFAVPGDVRYAAARETIKLDLFFLARRIQVFHQHDGYFGLTGADNLFLRAQNGVRLGLAGGLATTARVDVDYDRSPAPGRERTDRSFTITLGYQF